MRRWEDAAAASWDRARRAQPWRAPAGATPSIPPRRGLLRRRAGARPRAASSPQDCRDGACRLLRRLRRGVEMELLGVTLVAGHLQRARAPHAICRTWTRRASCSAPSPAPACPSRLSAGCAPSRALAAAAAAGGRRGCLEELAVIEVPGGRARPTALPALRDATPPGVEPRHRRRRRAPSAPAGRAQPSTRACSTETQARSPRPSNATTTQSMRSASACPPRAPAGWI